MSGVDFFEPVPVHEPSPSQRAPRGATARSAPEDEIGVGVPMRFVLAASPEITVVVGDVVAYREGFAFEVVIHFRRLNQPLMLELYEAERHGLASRLPRLGVEFSDGRRTRIGSADATTDRPLLARGDGSGGGWSQVATYWIWALPSPGQVAFVWEWPAQDMPLTIHAVDAGAILDAAGEVEQLFGVERGDAE